MSIILKVLIGLVAGYTIGVALGAVAAFVFGFEDAARCIAIGCGVAGAILGPPVLGRLNAGEC